MRRAVGMRADPAYVRQRLADGALYTRAEDRWLRQRSDLDDDRFRVESYTLEHADEYGGSSIEGKYPARPYVVYRWTAHRARHAAALRRLSKYPDRVRAAPARYSVSEVSELEERVRDDWFYEGAFFDGYGRAGLYVEWRRRRRPGRAHRRDHDPQRRRGVLHRPLRPDRARRGRRRSLRVPSAAAGERPGPPVTLAMAAVPIQNDG